MKTIKIDGREYQIDTDKALELGVLKEANPYNSWPVLDWEEYVTEMKRLSDINVTWYMMPHVPEGDAFVALGQLIHLRDAWWGKWKPDWSKTDTKYTIVNNRGCINFNTAVFNSRVLAFPTKGMAEAFYTTFQELIRKAKMFL